MALVNSTDSEVKERTYAAASRGMAQSPCSVYHRGTDFTYRLSPPVVILSRLASLICCCAYKTKSTLLRYKIEVFLKTSLIDVPVL